MSRTKKIRFTCWSIKAGEPNLNGRLYSETCLQHIAYEANKKTVVYITQPINTMPSLSDVIGLADNFLVKEGRLSYDIKMIKSSYPVDPEVVEMTPRMVGNVVDGVVSPHGLKLISIDYVYRGK